MNGEFQSRPLIILHHGLLGGGMGLGRLQWSSFRGLGRSLAAGGYPNFVTAVHPTAGIAERAIQLKKWILTNTPASPQNKMILVTHSMGGLDARHMITHLGMADFVQTLVTVSCPHRGSAYADWVFEHLGKRLRGIQLVMQMGLNLAAIPDLTTEACAKFNKKTPDVPGIKYFSISAARPRIEMPAFAMISHAIVEKSQGPNDGLVAVQSAEWGKHLATWRADHWQTVGRQITWRKRGKMIGIDGEYLSVLKMISATTQNQKN
jgi:triacylglycerol lipase